MVPASKGVPAPSRLRLSRIALFASLVAAAFVPSAAAAEAADCDDLAADDSLGLCEPEPEPTGPGLPPATTCGTILEQLLRPLPCISLA